MNVKGAKSMDIGQPRSFEAEEVEKLTQEEIWEGLDEVPQRRLRVELLGDDRGVFGVGTVGGKEYEQLRLITRPDRLDDPVRDWCALQPVPRPLFCHTVEGDLVDRLHRSMAARHGQIERENGNWRSWSKAPDPKLARQVYHGLKIKSLKIVNSLIRKALEVADQKALKAARRFPIRYRAKLYRSFCKYGERAIQLGDSFPFLAVMLFSGEWLLLNDDSDSETAEEYHERKKRSEKIYAEHVDLVLRGKKLKLISDSLGIPYALRHVTPRATNYVRTTKIHDIANYIPPLTRGQRVFFYAVRVTDDLGDQGFTLWAARLAADMTKLREFTDIGDIRDWVRACSPKSRLAPPDLPAARKWQRDAERRAEFITRRFSPDMSLRTVRRLCQEWHEAIASNMTEGELVKFPEPWIGGAEFGDHKIAPITDSRELYLASKRLHNCAANEYRESIAYGRACIYTVNNGSGAPVVMVELYRKLGERGWSNEVQLGQVKGYCNAPAPEEIEREVRKWFSREKRQTKLPESRIAEVEDNERADEEYF
jgi:hypothetical protein